MNIPEDISRDPSRTVLLSRRRLCELGILALLGTRSDHCYAVTDSPSKPGQYFGYATYERSNNDILDRAIIFELKSIIRVLEINPGFKYIKANNAFATEQSIVPGTRGTVFLGLDLIADLMKEKDGGISVAGVCAHECAHIHQMEQSLFQKLRADDKNISRVELHADFIAGYYVGKRDGSSSAQLRKFSEAIFKFGDYEYVNPSHHGTPGQRAASIEKGFSVANDDVALADATKIGLTYVLNL